MRKEAGMFAALASVVVCGFLAGGGKKDSYDGGFLCQPAYAMDDAIRGPVKRYVPQPGDIFLSTDRSWIINAGHRLAGSGQPNHSGIVVLRRDGTPALLEGG